MTLSRAVAVPGMLAEYEAFGELIDGLSAGQWATPTRCAGWTVADVAAHVVGQLTDVVQLRLDGLGTDEVTNREVAERKGRTPAELVDELRSSAKAGAEMASGFDDAAWEGPIQGVDGTLGFGIEALWFDTFVHADDIRSALGMASVESDGLIASASHLTQLLTERGWGPADVRLGRVGTFPVSGGGGRTIDAEPLEFALVASGRLDPSRLGLDETVNVYRS